jgi:hypothetical protein
VQPAGPVAPVRPDTGSDRWSGRREESAISTERQATPASESDPVAVESPDGPFVLAAPLGGSLLVTALAATGGVALAAVFVVHGTRRLVAAGTAAVIAGAPLAAGAAVTTAPSGTLDAAVVRGGGPRGLRAVFTNPQDTTDRQFAVAEQIIGSPDLVLFPEAVISVRGPRRGIGSGEPGCREACRAAAGSQRRFSIPPGLSAASARAPQSAHTLSERVALRAT